MPDHASRPRRLRPAIAPSTLRSSRPSPLRALLPATALLALLTAAPPLAVPLLAASSARSISSAPSPAPPFDPDLLSGLRARSIGPAVMSGRVTVIVGVETDPQTLYLGAASGGVWKSLNGGISWQPIFDDQPVASIGAIAVFRPSPDVVWVGTGEGNVRNSASVGNGVYRSLDAGKTWTHLGLDPTERISRIVLHPTDPDVAWVAALGREWGENPERGVFKTEDGGRSWKKVLFVDDRTGAADLAVDPANPQHLLAAMWQFRRWPWAFKSGGPGSGLYASYDGGRTWKRRTEEDGLPKGELGRINLAIARSNPEIVYAAVEAAKSALLRSTDGGRTFASVNQAATIAPRPFYFAELKVDPQWPNRVYSLGFNVKVSDDAGKTFTNLGGVAGIHGDYHTMWIDPGDPRHLFVGDDGGIAVSHDRGRSAAFVADLPLAQYYHVAVDMATPYHVYGGLQDNGSWRGPSSTWGLGGISNSAWEVVGGSDGFGTLPDVADGKTGFAMGQAGFLTRWDLDTGEIKDARPPAPPGVKLRFNWNAGLALDPFAPATLYYGSQFVHKSTDHGRSWTIISPDLTSNDPAWQKQNESGGLTPDVSGAENYTTILAIAPSPVERGLIWVGTDDGRVQLTRDGGKSWTSVEDRIPGVPAHTWVPEIRASRHAAGTAFVVFDDHRRSNWTPYLYRTDDYGKSWKNLAGKEVRGHALAIEQDPANRDLLFLGTEAGLWISADGGGHWWRDKYGLPTVPVAGLAVHPRDGDLVIATHGRALYVLDDVRPLATLSAATLSEPLHLFPVADARQHWQKFDAGSFGQGAAEFVGENRPYGALITFSVSGAGIPLFDEQRERQRKQQERAAAAQAAAKAAGGAPESVREKGEKGEKAEKKEEKKAETKDEKPGEEPPKAQIEVIDAAGRVIRHFKAPVKLGINRVAWGLERDDWKEPPPRPDQPPQEDPAGPEVPPGAYTVKVEFRGHQAKAAVRVLADPRSRNSEADWRQRWAAVERTGALQEAAATAIHRIARLRAGVDAALAREKQAADEKAYREREQEKRAGEGKEPAAAATIAPAPAAPAATTAPTASATPAPAAPAAPAAPLESLKKPAEKLGKALDELEKRLWIRPDAKGIPPQDDFMDQLGIVQGAVGGQWDPPSPAQLETLRQLGEQLDRFLADFNRFEAGALADFRKQVAAAGFALLPDEAPIAVAKP
jgi:photosystem II stability/assembly factor-like uncharacterized protein